MTMAEETTTKATEPSLETLSALVSRLGLAARLGKQFGENRDVYEVCGYNKAPDFDDYMARYERQDIARRVVDAPATATWREVPEVYEETESEDETEFEKQWTALSKRLQLRQYFERADKLAGIGCYSVLLVGLARQGELAQPAEKVSGAADVIYLQPYSEKNARITQYDEDPKSERYGLPLMYDLTSSRVSIAGGRSVKSTGLALPVHFSRVLHIAEGTLEDEVFGVPRLRGVYNLLDDLLKIVGGTGEMYWQGALRGLVAKLEKGYSLSPDKAAELKAEVEEYLHGLSRFIKTVGIDIDALPSTTPDPRGPFDVAISLVAAASGLPKRILLGSEAGELASSQDEKNWKDRVMERQQNFAGPLVIERFIDMMVKLGALPEPKDLCVDWPNLLSLSESEQADVQVKKANAMATYANSAAPEFFPPEEFREDVMDMQPEPEGGFPEEEPLIVDPMADPLNPQNQPAPGNPPMPTKVAA